MPLGIKVDTSTQWCLALLEIQSLALDDNSATSSYSKRIRHNGLHDLIAKMEKSYKGCDTTSFMRTS